MPDDQEQDKVVVTGVADIGGDLTPVSIRVPRGHPFLSMREGDTAPLPVDGSVQIDFPDAFKAEILDPPGSIASREISRAVADAAWRKAQDAIRAHDAELRRRLEGRRQQFTEAAERALGFYFRTMHELGAAPTATAAARHAVDSMLESLFEELRP